MVPNAAARLAIRCRTRLFPQKDESTMANIVEVIHFRPVADADPDELIREDARVGHEYTPKQPGFIDRQSGKNDNGDWVVIVHWEDVASAEASMAAFPKDPVATRFIELMDSSTFTMVRYDIVLDS
jgi:hypothetical protein